METARDLIIAGLVFAIATVAFGLIRREFDRRDFELKTLQYRVKPITYRDV
jgi:hypothetical protein